MIKTVNHTQALCDMAVMRASSWVFRSNLWSTASISLSPNGVFVNFSVEHRVMDNVCDSAFTEPPLIDLLGHEGKHRNNTIVFMIIFVIFRVSGIIV
jgi:hypothetical protein